MKICCVLGCSSSEDTNPYEKLFNFPLNRFSDKYLKWLAFAQNPELEKLKRSWICRKHFAQDKFSDCKRNRLLRNAIPTLHPPDLGEPVLPDHVYSLPTPPFNPLSCQSFSPPPPLSQSPQPPDDDVDEQMEVEILDEKMVQEKIYKLMVDVNLLTQENVELKGENVRLKIRIEQLKDAIRRLNNCTRTIIRKATMMSCEDFYCQKEENDILRSQLACMAEELVAMKKQRNRSEEDLSIFLSLQESAY